MLKFVNFSLIACTLFSPVCLSASSKDEANKKQMISNLESIRADFEIGYAPQKWKAEWANWDLNEQFEIAKQKILSTDDITVTEYQKILTAFMQSTKDYHVGVMYFSTEQASLPFTIKTVDDRYFVVYIDFKKFNPTLHNLTVGDEIISFGGRPMHEAVLEFEQAALNSKDEGTDRSLAVRYFTERVGNRGHTIPSGPVTIEVRDAVSLKMKSIQLCWEYIPEEVTSQVKHQTTPENKSKIQIEQPLFLSIHFDEDDKDHDDEEEDEEEYPPNPYAKGARDGYLPPLGKIIWRTEPYRFFDAYVYQTKDKNLVGYLRIPNYVPLFPELFFEDYLEIIAHLEECTNVLVIDQTNNPGGIVFYLYALVSALTDQALNTPQHRFTIRQEHVFTAAQLISELHDVKSDKDAVEVIGESLTGYPVNYQLAQFVIDYCRFIQKQWKMGHTLTDPYYLWGVDKINPHPFVRYTKPILLLIDELDFSGGDFFPAIMQDNKRAILMGTKTAGAGGYVRDRTITNLVGIAKYRYTESIAERIDKKPLENLGVTPDIEYKLTVEDLQFGFQGYVDAINDVVKILGHLDETDTAD